MMKKMMANATRMMLIIMTLMVMAGCMDESSDSDRSGDADADTIDATGYVVVDTGQITCYDNHEHLVACPAQDEPFYGQDAQYTGNGTQLHRQR